MDTKKNYISLSKNRKKILKIRAINYKGTPADQMVIIYKS